MPSTLEHRQIRAAFATARRETQARHRDIAQALGISEGELVAAHAGAHADAPDIPHPPVATPLVAIRLRADWPELIESMQPLGAVMALTRNEACVHEKTGVYRQASHDGHMGLVLGGAIDLRIFYGRWAHGFAVDESTAAGTQRSLQFFDAAGGAVHKVFQRETTDGTAWAALVERFRADRQHPGIVTVATPPPEPEAPDARIDVAALRGAWAAMNDTHEFFGLLRRHGVSRTQALRLADPQFVEAVPTRLAERVLHAAADGGVPIMVFVGNPGMIQIHSGPVHRVAVMGPWLNVLDPGFNLHLRADLIAHAWVVKKPTRDGIVTSLELFDVRGETIAMFFGERKPGRPELTEWRNLLKDSVTAELARMRSEGAPCAA